MCQNIVKVLRSKGLAAEDLEGIRHLTLHCSSKHQGQFTFWIQCFQISAPIASPARPLGIKPHGHLAQLVPVLSL